MFGAIIKWMVRLLALSLLAFIVGGGFLFFDYKRFLHTAVVTADSPETFAIQSGDTVVKLTQRFKANHLPLASASPFAEQLAPYYFRYLAKSTGKGNQLKIGDYQLQQGMTPTALLDLFTSGKTIAHKIRFLEGWNFKRFREQIQNNPNIEHTLLFVPDDEILAALNLGDEKVFYEGQFFPDTYQFPKQAKDSDIFKQAYQLMQKNLATAWQARDTSIALKSPYELLILASIIEKETSLDSERTQVSGVFHRRLAKGMPLQTDPTVIYGIGDKYNGTIYKSDLRRDTPYNTYTRKGLPPTPIAMPGMSSLLAAGQPDKGQSLYFVANGTGGHTFSDTYKQHLKAVKIYRQQQAAAKKKSP